MNVDTVFRMSPPPSIDEPTQYRSADNLQSRIDLHSRFSTAKQSWFEWLGERLDLKPGMCVLDVGSGPGTLWQTLDAMALSDIEVILVDRSVGMARTAIAETGYRCIAADAEGLPFTDDRFDVVLAAHMLYHVTNLDAAIAELRRILKSDGRLIAATNGAGHMSELEGLTGEDQSRLSLSLENGAGLLSRHFDQVRLELYNDELRVNDAEAAVGYLRSYRRLDDDHIAMVRSAVGEAVAKHGSFRVTKATGVFLASGSTIAKQVPLA